MKIIRKLPKGLKAFPSGEKFVLEEIAKTERVFIQFCFLLILSSGFAGVFDSRAGYFVAGVFFIRTVAYAVKVQKGLFVKKALRDGNAEVYKPED